MTLLRPILIGLAVILAAGRSDAEPAPRADSGRKAGRSATPAPTRPPLEPADVTRLPAGTERLDLYLLMGQSNMKGRGVMPDEPLRDARIVMMHMKNDAWYLARHPLHLVGDPRNFAGHDNAGVGPGLAFAEAMLAADPATAIGLIPCAVGGTSIRRWRKPAPLYDEALRRARRALESTAAVNGRIRGVLWLQGEADANAAGLAEHEGSLLALVDDLRADLADPDLPFVACTIGEMAKASKQADKRAMNRILLALPLRREATACVDARDVTSHIGDHVHFDTTAQNEIGTRFAKAMTAVLGR